MCLARCLAPSRSSVRPLAALIGATVVLAGWSVSAVAATPAIRLSAKNQVPACVTPQRLMMFLATRNKSLNPEFRDIAAWYKYHGESWRVRWDYAFYQMAIETNFLTYRAPNGRWGDVDPKQYNFAGIGTTGGGVPGNRFPDVGTGVLAQIQHLVVYSGEFVPEPVAPRTRAKQDLILGLSKPIARRRPVTFQDLSGRWAVDRRYGRSIESVARLYRKLYCRGGRGQQAATRQTLPWSGQPLVSEAPRPALRRPPEVASHARRAPPAALPYPSSHATATPSCRVQVASFGGKKTLLIRSSSERAVEITALDVAVGEEESMAKEFINAYAPGGKTIGAYTSRSQALATAHAICRKLTRSMKESGRLARFSPPALLPLR